MSEDIIDIIHGKRCPRCGMSKLYKFKKDNRLKCAYCYFRYSLKKITDDFSILVYFRYEHSAYFVARTLKCSYNKVYYKYMKYRQEILEYSDKKNIPKQTSISKIMKNSKKDSHDDFWAFAKKRLSKYRFGISENHLPLYQRELEFRYHYRKKDIFYIHNILQKIHFEKILPCVFKSQ